MLISHKWQHLLSIYTKVNKGGNIIIYFSSLRILLINKVENQTTNMSTKTLDNSILNLCRTCMAKITNTRKAKYLITNISVYCNEKTTVSRRINELLETLNPGIMFREDETDMPSVICMACISKMRVAYSFRQLCKETDMNLRSILNGEASNKVEYHDSDKAEQYTQICQAEEQYIDFIDDDVVEEPKVEAIAPKVEIEIEEINFSDEYEQAYDSDQALQDIEQEINSGVSLEKEIKQNVNVAEASNILSADEDDNEDQCIKEFIYSDADDSDKEWVPSG